MAERSLSSGRHSPAATASHEHKGLARAPILVGGIPSPKRSLIISRRAPASRDRYGSPSGGRLADPLLRKRPLRSRPGFASSGHGGLPPLPCRRRATSINESSTAARL